MYAVTISDEGDCYRCFPLDPGIETAALGTGEAAALGASEATALGTSASASSSAGESALSGTASASASLTFTLDSGASRSFFRDRTTVTPLGRPVAVSLADPSGGPVHAHFPTVLPCPAAPSGTLSGLYLPSFSTNLVSGADLQDGGVHQFTPAGQRVTHFTEARTGRHLAKFTRRLGSSLYTLTTESPPLTASGRVAASAGATEGVGAEATAAGLGGGATCAAGGPGATRAARGPGARGAAGAGATTGGTGAVPAVSGVAARPRPYFVPLLQQVLGLPPSTGPPPPLECPQPVLSQLQLQPASPLPAPSPYTGPTGGLAERREPASRPASPVRPARTSGRGSRQRPPPVPGTHRMSLRPSTAPLRAPLPSPPESSLPALPDPESDSLCAASPTVMRLVATVVTDPFFESTAASALVAELVDFAARCRLDYAASLVAES
ncbi:unnamed protein product [Closterium sp. NIES-64]|nr:unnamed protein product [Closterium sp. NIES-64]